MIHPSEHSPAGPGDSTGALGIVASAHARLVGHQAMATALSQARDAIEAAVEPLGDAVHDAEDRIGEDRRALIRHVLAATGATIPGHEDWYYGNAPVAVLRKGGRILVVARAGDAHHPGDGEDPAELLQLVILEDARVA